MVQQLSKRRNFTSEEDVILLRQINADQPFACTRGNKMDKWDATAVKIVHTTGFGRSLTGKGCSSRFYALLDKHRSFNKESALLSGVSEEYSEKIQLLDDLLELHDDWIKQEVNRAEEEKIKKEEEKKKAEVIRKQAMTRMKHNDAPDEETKPAKRQRNINQLMHFLQDDTEITRYRIEKEMEVRLEEKKMELQYRKMEREEDAKLQLQLREKESERFIEMMRIVMKAVKPTESTQEVL
jgi:hypothetical protein